MIFAELQGKLAQDYSRAHDRAEDLLTSTVFGLLRYIPTQEWLGPLLASVRQVRLTGVPAIDATAPWLMLGEATKIDIRFWQRRNQWGEPDVLLRLLNDEGKLVHLLLIEVKLYAPKSGRDDASRGVDDEEDKLEGVSRDQLVRYWNFLTETLTQACKRGEAAVPDVPAEHATLIYLTAHAVPPHQELQESLQGAPTMRLGWLSWFDVWRVVSDVAERTGSLPASDLRDLLAYKGFSLFTGFRSPELGSLEFPSVSARFWMPRPWFSTSVSLAPASVAGFWSCPRPARS